MGNASDYLAIRNVYDGSFQLGYLKHYVKAVDEGVIIVIGISWKE